MGYYLFANAVILEYADLRTYKRQAGSKPDVKKRFSGCFDNQKTKS